MTAADEGEVAERRSLKGAAIRGVKLGSLSAGTTAAVALTQTAVLARLLSPSEFGLVAATMVVVGFAQAFSDMGLSNSLIVKRDLSREEMSSVYWLNILAGVAVGVVVYASAPLFAAFFHHDGLTELVHWASPVFLLRAIGQPFLFLSQKEMSFRPVAASEISGALIGLAVAIVTAALGVGAIALIWGTIANALVSTLVLLASCWRRWRPMLRVRRAELRGHVQFGLYQMGERSVDYLSANVDYLLIGHFLGSASLGIYTIAYQLILRPIQLFNPVITRVAFPAFALRQKDNARMSAGYLEMIRMLAVVTIPAFVILSIVADDFVPFFFGSEWQQSVAIVEILCVVGITKSLGNPVGSLLLAKNRPDLGFIGNLGRLALLVVSLRIAVDAGIVAVALTYTAVGLIVFVFWQFVIRWLSGVTWRGFGLAVVKPALFSAGMAAVMLAAEPLVHGAVDRPVIRIAALVGAGAITYVILLARFDRRFTGSLLQMILGRRGRKFAPATSVTGR